jgi:hypothetical protein
MLKVDLTAIEEAKARFNGDLGLVKKELKRLQSVKCRLKKEKASADYQAKMEAVLDQEQVLKEVRSLLDPKEVKVPDFTQEDVDRLDYDQTIKAIKSIQSIKCLSLQDPSAHGQAELAKAEQNRKIKIEEAKANLEAEKLNAQAEIERAKGAAEAIRIENGSLTPTYIQYLWVRQQSNLNDKTVVYIPTEGNLPILEATRPVLEAPKAE